MDEQPPTPSRPGTPAMPTSSPDPRSARLMAASTGVSEVDTAIAALDDLDQLSVSQQVERYEAVHAVLQNCLAGLDRD